MSISPRNHRYSLALLKVFIWPPRSLIACGRNIDSFEGVYIHWDGTPTCRGPELLEAIKDIGVEKLRKHIRKSHGKGASTFGDFLAGKFYPDPQAGTEPSDIDPLHIEWIYLLDPEKPILRIFAGVKASPDQERAVKYDTCSDVFHYRYVLADELPLDSLNRDLSSFWEKISKVRYG